MIKVADCGGIGSGKSTVCRMFAERGVALYDSDARAKALMNESAELREALVAEFGAECYEGGVLNRAYLASKVFGSEEQLAKLNAIVHPAVKEDFLRWAKEQEGDFCILESAILFESGLNEVVDRVLLVWADAETCISRVEGRDGMSRQGVISRMNNQMPLDDLLLLCDYAVHNDGVEPVIPQVKEFIESLQKTIDKCADK